MMMQRAVLPQARMPLLAGASRQQARGVVRQATSRPVRRDAGAGAVSAEGPASRRDALLAGAAALLAVVAAPVAHAEEDASAAALAVTAAAASVGGYNAYLDPVDKFKLQVPSGWEFGSGEAAGGSGFRGATGGRRTLAWYPSSSEARATNFTMTVTNVSGEFTKLGSFGSANTFGTNLVNSMDRSYLLRRGNPGDEPIQIAKLIEADSVGDSYYIEYCVDNELEGNKRLQSLVTLGFNGTYNRLFTLTAQCREADLATYQKTFKAVLKSFVAPTKAA